jgi:hypothetical protein
MFWSRHNVKKLHRLAAQAQNRIREFFVNNVITNGGDAYAWGQFMNEGINNRQIGIYGTSAGMQVLLMTGEQPSHRYVQGASKTMRTAFEDKSSKFYRNQDTALVYKLAHLAESAHPEQLSIDSACLEMDELIKRVIPSEGWGEFYYTEQDRDIHSKVVSTATALLALRRHRQFRASVECEKALEWLCKRVLEEGEVAAYNLALASLALIEYSTPGQRIARYNDAVAFCKQQLITLGRSRKKVFFSTIENHHYASSSDGSGGNKYLFFLPDCLTALALLKWDFLQRQNVTF